jgi:hypothetical protein
MMARSYIAGRCALSVAQTLVCVGYARAARKPHRLKPVPLESRKPGAFHLIIMDEKKSNIDPVRNKLSARIFLRELCDLSLCVRTFGIRL